MRKKKKRADRMSGELSDLAVRFIAMGLVFAIAALGVAFSPARSVTVFIMVLAAMALLVLFFGSERQARPILFAFRPLTLLIQWIVSPFS